MSNLSSVMESRGYYEVNKRKTLHDTPYSIHRTSFKKVDVATDDSKKTRVIMMFP